MRACPTEVGPNRRRSRAHLQIDNLFPRAEPLQLLRFAESELDERRQLLAQYLVAHVPLVAPVRRVLADRACHTTCPVIGLSASGRSAHERRTGPSTLSSSSP